MTRKETVQHNAPRPRIRRQRAKERAADHQGSFLFRAVRAAVTALAVGAGCLTVLCAVCMALDDPCAYAPVLSRLALLPASVTAGVLSAKKSGAGGIPSGAAAGLLLILLLFGIGVLIPGEAAEAHQSDSVRTELLSAAACFVLSCVSGYMVTHKKPKLRRKRH
ncbi:MAG: hypothetical protein ACI3XM_10710 [Eubacteriales bacterium]